MPPAGGTGAPNSVVQDPQRAHIRAQSRGPPDRSWARGAASDLEEAGAYSAGRAEGGCGSRLLGRCQPRGRLCPKRPGTHLHGDGSRWKPTKRGCTREMEAAHPDPPQRRRQSSCSRSCPFYRGALSQDGVLNWPGLSSNKLEHLHVWDLTVMKAQREGGLDGAGQNKAIREAKAVKILQ